MADHSAIQWTDATWNPIVGCSITSPGCAHCYAMPMAARIERMQPGSHYAGTTMPSAAGPVWTGKVAIAPDHILTQPLRWRRPRRIFVNSMGDLCHEDVPDEWIDRVFAVMALCPQHDFQVLTKRSARMRAYMCAPGRRDKWVEASWPLGEGSPLTPQQYADRSHCGPPGNRTSVFSAEVLPNVWLGVTAEDQARADERIPDLLATPAAIRFVSCEPLLGPVDMNHIRMDDGPFPGWSALWKGNLVGRGWLDLVIAGGESGPRARPMHPDWARSLRDQCAATGTPFFFKQWGEWEVAVDRERDDPDWRFGYGHKFGDAGATKWLNLAGGCGFHGERFHVMRRVGKHRPGRLLDGVEHNDLPRRTAA